MEIGYIGLGAIGRPMAARLAARFPTRVFNRTAAVAHAHAAASGSEAVEDLRGLAAVDVVCSCLPTDVEVAAAVDELAPHLSSGTVWLDHTSGAPAGSRAIAARLATRGVAYLDAPVSGGPHGAASGELAIMVGGESAVLAQIEPVLAEVAGRVVHVGPVGSGMAVKAVNNALLATCLQATAEGLVALAAQGVDASTALQVLNAASGRSFASEVLFPERVLDRSYPFSFALGLLAKDLGLAEGVVADAGASAPALSVVAAQVRAAVEHLGADADHVELVRVVEQAAELELR